MSERLDPAVDNKGKGTFGCKSAPYHICLIRAYFSVARFVISGGSRFGFAQCMINISE